MLLRRDGLGLDEVNNEPSEAGGLFETVEVEQPKVILPLEKLIILHMLSYIFRL